MSRILVTGANGFVGRALCASLKTRGVEFVPAYRKIPAESPNGVGVGDIDGATDWSAALVGVKYVVHLASRVHVMDERNADPLAAYRQVNTAGTLNLARQAQAAGVERFVFVSTVKVHGEGRAVPYRESDSPDPQEAYAVSKSEAECALREVAGHSSMDAVILRPPLVYGPGVSANFRRLTRALQAGWPLPFGRIDNRRSMIYVGNLVSAIEHCLTHPQAANRTFLVSDGEDLSTTELLRRLGAALGRPARLAPLPVPLLRGVCALLGRSAMAERLFGSLSVDSSALREALGWTPPYGLDEGLRLTAEFFLNAASDG